MIIEPIRRDLKMYMKTTDEANLAETSWSGPENTLLENVFIALKGH